MKKLTKLTLVLTVTLVLFTAICTPSYAYTLTEGVEYVDGVSYKIDESGTFFTVIGYVEDFPTVNILSEVNGIPVTKIAETAFMNKPRINKVIIADSVTEIGAQAFKNCENLLTVVLPKNLASIPEECFDNCTILKNITLPSTLVSIGDRAFRDCKMVGKIKIPASVTEIGHEAFLHCESIMLDVSENEYAKSYAETQNINTQFKGTSSYFLLVIVAVLCVSALITAIIFILLKRHLKKRPDHDPVIYVERFFEGIGKGLSFLINKAKLLLEFLVDLIIALYEKAKKKLRQRKEEKELKKNNQDIDNEKNG